MVSSQKQSFHRMQIVRVDKDAKFVFGFGILEDKNTLQFMKQLQFKYLPKISLSKLTFTTLIMVSIVASMNNTLLEYCYVIQQLNAMII